MDAQAKTRGGSTVLIIAIGCIVVLLPVLYVLSAGPVVYLQSAGKIEMKAGSGVATFYYPLTWAQTKFPPFMRLMNWYGRKWEYRPPAPVAQDGK